MVTFAVYTAIAVYWKSKTLLMAQAFTSLALISLLTTPVVVFIQGLPLVMQCIGNFNRIQEYCSYHQGPEKPEIGTGATDGVAVGAKMQQLPDRGDKATGRATTAGEGGTIRFEGRGFSWDKASPVVVLRDISVDIKRGSVTAIVGLVGSGKSSFLSALLGELAHVQPETLPEIPSLGEGEETQPRKQGWEREPMAYCAQHPWLENGTIRQNIVGASAWDPQWYSTVGSACCLDDDLRLLKNGDETSIGSRGVNLSGGQKQRIVSFKLTIFYCDLAQEFMLILTLILTQVLGSCRLLETRHCSAR